MWTHWTLLGIALLLGVIALAVFAVAVKSGIFNDVEDAKYVVLRAEEETPGPPPPPG